MRRLAVLGSIGALALSVLAFSSSGDVGAARARYVVRFADDAPAWAWSTLLSDPDVELHEEFRLVFRGAAVTMSAARAAELRDDPAVASVEPDAIVQLEHAEQAPALGDIQTNPPWGLDRIDEDTRPLDRLYSYPNGGAGVAVYVIDSGIRGDHAQFGGRVTGGFTAVHDGLGTGDCEGHGTAVASVVGGGTTGVAKQASIVPVRVFGCELTTQVSTIISGIEWVVGNHQAGVPAVANVSIGGDPSNAFDRAVDVMVWDGITVVVAAGNRERPACDDSPGRAPWVLTVAASGPDDKPASFSNFGRCVDLYAPGVSIPTASKDSPTAMATFNGTSMATPHVAGAAAIILSEQPSWRPGQVVARLLAVSVPMIVSPPADTTPRLLFQPPGGVAVPPAYPPPGADGAATAMAQAQRLGVAG